MAIPEPEYIITVFQMEAILKDLGINPQTKTETRPECIHRLRNKLNEYLDTV